MSQISNKASANLRVVSFNINGANTVVHYHPWNGKNFCQIFQTLQGDVITLQELKLQSKDLEKSLHLDKLNKRYHSFISLPKQKKGYSGVGLFIRIPSDDESEAVRKALCVIKAEEGITGFLACNKSKNYIASENCIGGYPLDCIDEDSCENETTSEKWALELDSQGRCVVVELNFDIVIIALYCPANSMGTDEGDRIRTSFIRYVTERARNLEKAGKHVLVMGDINIARDLIDRDDYLTEWTKDSRTGQNCDGRDLEQANWQKVVDFRNLTPARRHLNSCVYDEYFYGSCQANKVDCVVPVTATMHDLIREKQARRLKLYTVWNTLKNNRPFNIGSRIDLILTTNGLTEYCSEADIWNFLYGSDHCPVYADFNIAQFSSKWGKPVHEERFVSHKDKTHKMEVKKKFGLSHLSGSGITGFFTRSATPKSESEPTKRRKIDYKSRKPQNQSIENFFNQEQPGNSEQDESKCVKMPKIDAMAFQDLLSKKKDKPLCLHNEPCVLRTSSRDNENRGKKFWSCARQYSKPEDHHINSKETLEIVEKSCRCDFFKWVSR